MRKRSRTFAGFVATAAFLFSLVAGIQASMCAVEGSLDSSGMAAAAMPMAHGHEAPTHGTNDCIGQHGDENGMPYCPFMPLAAGPTCAVAFLLPASIHGVTSSTVAVREVSAVAGKPDLLFATSLFHPPKA